MAADDVGHKKFGESCLRLCSRGLTGRRTSAGSPVSVGVPPWKKRAFVAATTSAGTPKANDKLHTWRRGVERATGPNTLLGGILGRNRASVLKKGAGERVSFCLKTVCFPQPRLTLWAKNSPHTRTNAMRRTQLT